MPMCINTNNKELMISNYVIPEGVDAVDDTRHVFSVVEIRCDWIEDLGVERNKHTHTIANLQAQIHAYTMWHDGVME